MPAPPRGNLRAVPSEGGSPEPAPGGSARATRWLSLLALLLLLAALAGLGVQTRRVAELEGEVRGLSASLSAARTSVSAYQAHLDEVRASVTGLSEQVDALEALVAHDPVPSEPGAPPPASEPSPRP